MVLLLTGEKQQALNKHCLMLVYVSPLRQFFYV